MWTAITRKPSPAFSRCALEYAARLPIDVPLATRQHREYEACLANLGLRVISLPPLPDLPDSSFVEDPAIVVDQLAVITRMGAGTRRGESAAIADALSPFRPLRYLREPATLEGGDVMRIGGNLFVGMSTRTNAAGIAQLLSHVSPLGYSVIPVNVGACLHMKTACSYLGDGKIFANRDWLDTSPLHSFEIIDTPLEEPWSANVLRIGDTVLIPTSFPAAAGVISRAGYRVQTIDISELMKAEAGLTCLSVIFDAVV